MSLADLYHIYQDHPVICTDSRSIEKGSIFFALVGEHHDGNQYAIQAIEKGAYCAIVSDKSIEHEQCILVNDTLVTLQQLAHYHRQQFDIPVIGITGSNGKTTTKELLTRVLSQVYKVHATPGNFNNHIGVPLTLLAMGTDTEIAIIEMGANHVGEIQLLSSIAHPNFGLITNIGSAHLEGFGGIAGIQKGKSELFHHIVRHQGHFFVNGSDDYLRKLAEQYDSVTTYGDNNGFDIVAILVDNGQTGIAFDCAHDGQFYRYQTQLYGAYNLMNCASAIAVGTKFNVPIEDIQGAIESYAPENNRSQIKQIGSNTVIMDAYNANPSSMEKAIEAISGTFDQKVLILGDMKELGAESQNLHQEIVDLITSERWEKVFFVGPEFQQTHRPTWSFHYDNVDELIAQHPISKFKNKTILLKGSRSMRLEKYLITEEI